MNRNEQARAVLVVAAVVGGVVLAHDSRAGEPSGRDIPPAFSPLEYLVGQWKGTATPEDGRPRFRGWTEKHSWAWTFTRGQPSGMSLAIQDGEVLANGKLSYDPGRKRYRLEATAPKPRGGPIAFEGNLDATGKTLVLEQVSEGNGSIRLKIFPNGNFVRYTMAVDRKEPGSSQFRSSVIVGVTRDGESLAGGSGASERPRCIVTGGAATMTMEYNGQTFPICCTGCRDEFQENPRKYIEKASVLARSAAAKAQRAPSARPVRRFSDAFASDVADASPMKNEGRSAPRAAASATTKARTNGDAQAGESNEPAAASKNRPAAGKNGAKAAARSPQARAASLLRIARNLEKSGKNDAALADYKRIVKEFGETPSAKIAIERIKALEKR